VVNRRNGKVSLKYGLRKLARDAGYARTATSIAIKGLRNKIGLKAARTGRALLFEVPTCAEDALKEHRSVPSSVVQQVNNRSPKSEPRNKGPLKKQLQNGQLQQLGEGNQVAPVSAGTCTESTSGRGLALDFAVDTNCSLRVSIDEYVSRYGFDRLRAELARMQHHRRVSIEADDAGSLHVVVDGLKSPESSDGIPKKRQN